MSEEQRSIIKELVITFASYAGVNDTLIINNKISKLWSMHILDAVDMILIDIDKLLLSGKISAQDVYKFENLFLKLYSDRYKIMNDFVSRLNYIKEMNLDHKDVNLEENHRMVIEAFESFNLLLGGKFDSYYTGGLMGYLVTNQSLERYHEDLDLFINEAQLSQLKSLVDASEDFEFVVNLSSSEVGHEFKILYKGGPICIGLFLFERGNDNSITIKDYYYGKESEGRIYVNENHLSREYTDLVFSNDFLMFNGSPYRTQSLEAIYNVKKNGRPKDKRDAFVIKDYIDMLKEYYLDVLKMGNTKIYRKEASSEFIQMLEILEENKRKL